MNNYRQRLVDALPTFMNQCEGGACGNEGEDIKLPDEFEIASLAALENIDTIKYAPYHRSHKIAIFNALKREIDQAMRFL